MKKKDPAQVMIDVCLSLQSKINAGDYDNMLTVVHEPWKGLHVAQRSTLLDMDSLDSADEPQVVQRTGFAGIGAALSQAWAHWNIPGFSVQGHLGRWLPNQTGVHLPEVLPGARRGPQGRHEFSFAPGSGKYRRACATCIGFTCNRCLFVCLFVC